MARQTGAALGALAGIAFLAGSLFIGVQLMQAVGADSMVAAGGDTRLASQPELLTVAELLKFGSALAALPVIGAIGVRLKSHGVTRQPLISGVGYIASLLLIASGAIGLIALHLRLLDPVTATGLAHGLGLASAAGTGLWAALSGLTGWRGALPRWLCVTGILMGITALATAVTPAIGMLLVLISLVWLIGLTVLFLKRNG